MSFDLSCISLENQEKIDQFSAYFREQFGITHILYTVVLPNNRYFVLCGHIDFLKEYLASSLPTHYASLAIPPIYMPCLGTENAPLKALFDKHGLYHPITFTHTNLNLQETCTLFHEQTSPQVINLYLNSVNKLQHYCNTLHKSISELIETYRDRLPMYDALVGGAKTAEESVVIPNMKRLKITNALNHSIEKLVQVIPNLTFREAQILQFYLEYCSAKEIARYTDLSARTVEKHIENFKKKIGSHKKSVILQIVKDKLNDTFHTE